jgi:hypothetical protein
MEDFLLRPGELLGAVGGFKLPAPPPRIAVRSATPAAREIPRTPSKLLLSGSDKMELTVLARWTADHEKICRMWLASKCLTEESDFDDWYEIVEQFLAQK